MKTKKKKKHTHTGNTERRRTKKACAHRKYRKMKTKKSMCTLEIKACAYSNRVNRGKCLEQLVSLGNGALEKNFHYHYSKKTFFSKNEGRNKETQQQRTHPATSQCRQWWHSWRETCTHHQKSEMISDRKCTCTQHETNKLFQKAAWTRSADAQATHI